MTRSKSSSTSGNEKRSIVGGTVLTISRGAIQKGTVLIERGKDADVVVWSAHPFDIMSKAEMVFIDGRTVAPEEENH